MLTISSVLGNIIKKYYEDAISNDRESRLIVPGLSSAIAEQVHDFLISNGITSYLVVGSGLSPDEEKFWISPVGLTSKRIGSFVAISTPGQLASMQDSIRGSGGAIRSVAFSEEWPWIDHGSEAFCFNGPVLRELVLLWSNDTSHQEWLREFIRECLLPATRSYPQRVELLFEKVLGSFSPDLYPEINDLRLKFLFHVGIPCPTSGVPSVEKLVKEMTSLCQRIVDRCRKEDNVRQSVIQKAEDLFHNEVRNRVIESLHSFLDALGQSKTLDLGPLALHGCWGPSPGDWLALHATQLERLFEVAESKPAELTITIECERAIVSDSPGLVATFSGEELHFSGTYVIPEEELGQYNWVLRLTCRQEELLLMEIDSHEGSFHFDLDTSKFKSHRTGLPLRIGLYSNDEIRAEERIKLHLCGGDRPSFALVEPGFEILDSSFHDKDGPPDKKIETDDAVHIFLFSVLDTEPKLIDLDEISYDLIETGKEGILRSGNRIDPSNDPSGQVTRVCQFGEKSIVVCFEAKDIERGEFTLEDEFRTQIAGERNGRIKEIHAIFEGTRQDPYLRLGKLNNASRNRILLALDMTNERGWRPLLVDLVGSEYKSFGEIGDYLTFRGTISDTGFNRMQLPDEAVELVREYAQARFEIIKNIKGNIKYGGKTMEHPVYATHPIYVDNRSEEIEKLIMQYLTVYLSILDYVGKEKERLEWNQIFVLLYLDCVVNWDKENSLRNSIFLVGPWQPLNLAKRYMIQASLFARSQRLEGKGGKIYRHLATLLKGITGYRWIPGLHRNGKTLEPLYVFASSDPGWQVAIKDELNNTSNKQGQQLSLKGVLRHLEDSLGLHTPVFEENAEGFACSAINSYLRSFPSRRSLGIRIARGYPVNFVISSIDHFLHTEDKPTEIGESLPGGIRLICTEKMTSFEDINSSEPPIFLHQFENDTDCFSVMKPDIYLLQPTGEVSQTVESKNQTLPRGLGRQSVFYEPLYWLTEGQSQLPNSLCQEIDTKPQEQEGIGKLFVGSTAKICKILPNLVVTVCSVNLPFRLPCPWVVAPGKNIDPAILIKYALDGSTREIQERVLWDYKFDIGESRNTYYILSSIPRSFAVAVNGFFGKEDIASKLIEELGALGIAIGGEALKSGRHALGVVGLVGAIRLINGCGEDQGVFLKDSNCLGFVISIDSFDSFFGKKPGTSSKNDGTSKRTDLLAIQLVLPNHDGEPLTIYACGIESKFVSNTFRQQKALEALYQAQTSLEQFRTLVEEGLSDGAMPERLGLLAILRFGLRITSPGKQEDTWIEAERQVYKSILTGRYKYQGAKYNAVVVSTEGKFPGVAEASALSGGLWVRINKNHWPGVSDTPSLYTVREQLSLLFGINEKKEGTKFGEEEFSHPDDVLAVPTSGLGRPVIQVEEPNIPTEEIIKPLFRGNTTELPTGDKSKVSVPIDNEGKGARLGKILLGVDDARRPVYLDPQSPIDPLDNLNLMITGSAGTGKTQLLKYLICKIREQGKNMMILDFKNDFASDSVFADKASLDRVIVNFDGLPFNPLIPFPVRHPVTGKSTVQVGQHISGIASVLKRTYNLGAQQQVHVKNAILEAFSSMGIPTSEVSSLDDYKEFPDLDSVGEILRESNPLAYNRLDPLFTLNLFQPAHKGESFQALINRSMILDLSKIPSDAIKNALAEMIVLSAHSFYNTQPHSGIIRQFLVFDEAYRVLESDYMANLVRECRAYGVGTILSSQNPSDFPGDISSQMATKVLHGNGRDADKVRTIVQLIGCSGQEAEVSNLDRFQAFLDNRHSPHTLIRTMNYPLYLLWSLLLQKRQATRQEIVELEGIETDKLPLDNLVRQIERLGLAEEKEGFVNLIQLDA